jgi:predicted ABC-type exoprotein transport system permease subunit
MSSIKSRISAYIRENPGSDFIVAFMIAMLLVALVFPFDQDMANELANLAFFTLVAGVILQALALRHRKEDSA